jgi:hypothetical protein
VINLADGWRRRLLNLGIGLGTGKRQERSRKAPQHHSPDPTLGSFELIELLLLDTRRFPSTK